MTVDKLTYGDFVELKNGLIVMWNGWSYGCQTGLDVDNNEVLFKANEIVEFLGQ